MIAPAPACPGLPARTMPALDVFFEASEYVIWYTAQQAAYIVVRDEFVAADKALEGAIEAYEIQLAVRNTQYCDWKNELEAACSAFDVCFSEAADHYTNELVPSVTSSMNGRIEIKKAGDTVVHQIQFLLGQVEDQATPEIDTSRYEIDFPDLPAKGLCDLSPLDADDWVPSVQCAIAACTSAPLLPQASSANLWSGTSGKFTFSGTSNPRPETTYNNAYLDGVTVVNGAFEVTVNFVGTIAGIGMRGSQADGDYYLCRLDSRPNEGVRIVRSPNTLISPRPFAPDAEGVDIRMRMEVSGNSIKCYKDGELVAEATDNNFPTHGELLLVTFDATATFTIESCEA